MSVVVDALGKQCPIPVVMAKKALAELQTPDTLEILVDNEAAVQNLSKLAASCQLPVRAEKTGEKRFSVTGTACGGDRLCPGCPWGSGGGRWFQLHGQRGGSSWKDADEGLFVRCQPAARAA